MSKLIGIMVVGSILMLLTACSQPTAPEPSAIPDATQVPSVDFVSNVQEVPYVLPCSGDASCSPRDVSSFSLLQPRFRGALFEYETPGTETVLERGLHGLGASPAHIVVRGTPVEGSVRCVWQDTAMTNQQREGAVRALLGISSNQHLPTDAELRSEIDAMVGQINVQYRDAFRTDFDYLLTGGIRSDGQIMACFVNFSINEYILGSGTNTLTVAYDGLAKTRSYELYKKAHTAGRYGDASLQSATDYAASQRAMISLGKKEIKGSVDGRESIIFLAPMGSHRNIGVESWQSIAQWDLQTVNGTVNAVRYGASSTESEYSQTLADLKTRVKTAAASDAFAGKRIANVNGLNQYYRDIGAYADITPGDGVDNPFTPSRPPSTIDCDNGVAAPSPAANPGLVSDCKVLAALHDALDSGNKLNWDDDQAVASWPGVTLTAIADGPQRVGQLALPDLGLTGPLPPELSQLAKLTTLDLQQNQITGSIPARLTDLTELTSLNLSRNQLTGAIPTDVGDLTKLTLLRLHGNDLNGTLPTSLGDLAELQWLNLGDNQLTGTIPTELASASKLEDLRLDRNDLTGGIPAQLGGLSNLRRLIVSENRLSGSIPTQLSKLTMLTDLWLDDNQLTGTIPTELGSLTNLTDLVLGDNGLTGSVPTQLGSLSHLVYLDLADNSLSGPIPVQLGSLGKLETLRLHNNSLTGSLPSTLTSLTELEELYAAGNSLTGCVPAALRRVAFNDLSTLNLPTCG